MAFVRSFAHGNSGHAGGTHYVMTGVDHPPAEHLVRAPIDSQTLKEPSVAAGVLVAEALSFGATLERLLEVLLVVLVGVALPSAWDVRALGLAAATASDALCAIDSYSARSSRLLWR